MKVAQTVGLMLWNISPRSSVVRARSASLASCCVMSYSVEVAPHGAYEALGIPFAVYVLGSVQCESFRLCIVHVVGRGARAPSLPYTTWMFENHNHQRYET